MRLCVEEDGKFRYLEQKVQSKLTRARSDYRTLKLDLKSR